MKIMNLENYSYQYHASSETEHIINWITKSFAYNEKALVELADNDYSPITANLCVKAIGKENVVGVIFIKADDKISDRLQQIVKELDLKEVLYFSIDNTLKDFAPYLQVEDYQTNKELTNEHIIKFKAMTLSSLKSRYGKSVSGYTLSDIVTNATIAEQIINYDICPVADFTNTEVLAIAKSLKLSSMFLKEQRNLEFNYTNLDMIIREGSCNNKDEEEKIWNLIHNNQIHKYNNINNCKSFLPNCIF